MSALFTMSYVLESHPHCDDSTGNRFTEMDAVDERLILWKEQIP